MRDKEYDRFGPWVYEISEEDPIPPLFINHIPADEHPLLSIKIPRKIDRSDARPGWNLYDYVVSMYENYFKIWKRIGNDVEGSTFRYEEVVCIKDLKTLLNGNLTIITINNEYSFSYNTVSANLIDNVVSVIRKRYNQDAETQEITEYNCLHEDDLDFYFSNILQRERMDNPEFKLLFCQKRINLGVLEDRIIKKLFYKISAMDMLQTLHLCDGKEIKIIGRERGLKNILQPVYGRENVYLPLHRLTNIETERRENSVYSIIHIKAENCYFKYYASNDNPTLSAYTETLRKLL